MPLTGYKKNVNDLNKFYNEENVVDYFHFKVELRD